MAARLSTRMLAFFVRMRAPLNPMSLVAGSLTPAPEIAAWIAICMPYLQQSLVRFAGHFPLGDNHTEGSFCPRK